MWSSGWLLVWMQFESSQTITKADHNHWCIEYVCVIQLFGGGHKLPMYKMCFRSLNRYLIIPHNPYSLATGNFITSVMRMVMSPLHLSRGVKGILDGFWFTLKVGSAFHWPAVATLQCVAMRWSAAFFRVPCQGLWGTLVQFLCVHECRWFCGPLVRGFPHFLVWLTHAVHRWRWCHSRVCLGRHHLHHWS